MLTPLPDDPKPEPAAAVPEPARHGSYLLRRPGGATDLGVSPKERHLLTQSTTTSSREDAALRNQVTDLERLLEMSCELSAILEPEVLFTRVLDFAVELTKAEKGLLMRQEGGTLRGRCARNHRGESIDLDTPVSRSLTQQCLDRNDIVLYDSLQSAEAPALGQSLKTLNILSAVCVPLREAGTPNGVLYLDSSSLELVTSTQRLLLLRSLASHASVALANAAAHRDLESSRAELSKENEGLKAELRADRGYARMIGQCAGMIAVYEKIRLLKDTDVFVLVQGECGTGKELVARALHEEGARRDKPFIAVNCGGIPENLLESSMFGYCRGAFTGALRDTMGWVEAADGGTLFLDEVADLPLSLQVKLLRMLDGGGFERVGESGIVRHADTRVISATNADLWARTEAKQFRDDLYYRLAVARIDLPPLKERREDIPLLIDHFLESARKKIRRPIGGITPKARLLLMQNPWKGNVRELSNVILGAAALVPEGGMIDVPQLQAQMRDQPASELTLDLSGSLEEAVFHFERGFVVRILNDFGWNISSAAKVLQISRQHLHNLIKRHGLTRPPK